MTVYVDQPELKANRGRVARLFADTEEELLQFLRLIRISSSSASRGPVPFVQLGGYKLKRAIQYGAVEVGNEKYDEIVARAPSDYAARGARHVHVKPVAWDYKHEIVKLPW